jgi:hypothetical protein
MDYIITNKADFIGNGKDTLNLPSKGEDILRQTSYDAYCFASYYFIAKALFIKLGIVEIMHSWGAG